MAHTDPNALHLKTFSHSKSHLNMHISKPTQPPPNAKRHGSRENDRYNENAKNDGYKYRFISPT